MLQLVGGVFALLGEKLGHGYGVDLHGCRVRVRVMGRRMEEDGIVDGGRCRGVGGLELEL